MINLNSIKYEHNNEKIKNIILSKFTEEDIFRHYLGNFKIGKPFNSPFRTDNTPSFSIFIGRDTGALLYNEILYKEVGNCFKFVKNIYNIDNYYKTYLKIANDLNIIDDNINYKIIKNIDKVKHHYKPPNLEIGVKYRKWNNDDKLFWQSFNINRKLLEQYNVKPISYIFYNDFGVHADKLAYVFEEYKDGNITFKIYQPYNKKYKWSNNHDSSVWQGWNQLQGTKSLIITSSLKDTLSIRSLINIDVMALQAETTKPKPHIIKSLKTKYKTIYVFYDNDYTKDTNWGQQYALDLCKEYDFINICIPTVYKTKDFSDMIQQHNTKIVKTWLDSILELKN